MILNWNTNQHGSAKVSHTVNGLATALGKLLTIDGSNVGKSVLAEEVAQKPVVDAITASHDFTDKVYTKTAADTAFVKTADLATKVAKKAVVDAITASSDFTGKVYSKTAADTAFVKATELTAKAAAKDVVDAITASSDFTDKVYTKNDADTTFVKTADLGTKVAKKAVVDAITASSDFTGKVYTKTAADTAFVKTADLATKVAKKAVVDAVTASSDFTNKVYIKAAPADEVYTKTAADTAFVKATELKTKAAAKDVVEAIFDAKDGNDKISETKIGATFAKKTDLDNKANIDGTNLDDAKVTVILDKLTDKVVKTSELSAKVAEKAVVDALIPELAKGDDDKGIYTKKGVDDAFVKTLGLTDTLKTEVVKQPVVDALIPELAKGDDDKGIYTKKGMDDAFVKILGLTDTLKTEVVKQPVVDALTASPDFTNKVYIKAAKGDEVYTKTAADTAFVKTDGSNIATQADKGKALADAILAAQDNNKKSVLVEKLGEFLGSSDEAKYDGKNNQTAKVFLEGKGLKGEKGEQGANGKDGKDGAQGPQGEKGEQGANGTSPSAAEVIAHPNFAIGVTEEQVKNFVQKEISQTQIFDIPSDPNAPISADW
ncbi:collagen-like protein [Wolbachia endosymbiont (group A) of Bibio marci]|uniref:collagen-like protein n=1 Tax=Wolbachia endosymbiont (group A) of Bibio marci TaxID=2953987 RepID=UPI00222F4787|nr:collagen-like protein [Wolbachia endosymbiont (group A) of Bibio marci]